MRLPVVRIRNKTTGKRMTVNEIDWASDLGLKRFRGWERIGEAHGDPIQNPVKVDLPSGPTVVDEQEAERMDTGVRETPKYREVQRRRGRPRKNQMPNLTET